MKHLLSLNCFSLMFLWAAIAHAQSLKGKIVDASTRQPIAFAVVALPDGSSATLSSIEGDFELKIPKNLPYVKVSQLGYKPVAAELPLNGPIYLQANITKLREVEILPGRNPADVIIEQVIKHREEHNPENLPAFKYQGYSKFVCALKQNADAKSSGIKEKKSFNTDSMYLFLSEALTEKIYKRPGKVKERVIAARVSGLQHHSFSILASQIQSFSFYNDLTSIDQKAYINPIKEGTFKRYFFNLLDTLYNQQDTTFIISFAPKRNAHFEALKGTLYINKADFAIKAVNAYPADTSAALSIKITQLYEKVNGRTWFPSQLNSQVSFKLESTNPATFIMQGKTYLKYVDLHPNLVFVKFDDIVLNDSSMEAAYAEKILDTARIQNLNRVEKNSYYTIDSLGEKIKLDKQLFVIKTIATGSIPYKKLDFLLPYILDYNRYEGLRLGLGLESNEKLLKKLKLGAYVAYGLKDNGLKYGTWLRIPLQDRLRTELKLTYKHDVQEPASNQFLRINGLLGSEAYRKYLTYRMDHIDQIEFSALMHPFNYMDTRFFSSIENRDFNSDYSYQLGNKPAINKLQIVETGLLLYYAYGETYTKSIFGIVPNIGSYPTLRIDARIGTWDRERKP